MRDEHQARAVSMLQKRRAAMAAVEIAAEAWSVPLGQMMLSGRQRARVSEARQMAMYLAHVVGGLTMREVAIEFGRRRSTVSHACHAIEDRRESVLYDREIDLLERALRRRIGEIEAEMETRAARVGIELKSA